MTKEELNAVTSETEDFDKIYEYFEDRIPVIKVGDDTISQEDVLRQYDPYTHAVQDEKLREDKMIFTQEKGRGLDGNETTRDMPTTVKVARRSIPHQKLIVSRAVAFALGQDIELECNPKDDDEKAFFELVKKIWTDCKLQYELSDVMEFQMSETRSALIFYFVDDPEYWEDTLNKGKNKRPRVMILAKSKGDDLTPLFDEYGQLIALGRAYVTTSKGKELRNLIYYTDTNVVRATEQDNTWEVKTAPHGLKKIPGVYFDQPLPEWSDVQPIIEGEEEVLSDFSDTNKYFSSPAAKVKGDVEGWSVKGEVGKVYEVGEDGDVEYLTWDVMPESIKVEMETYRSIIYSHTQTPNISFESMKAFAGSVSGIALKLLFLDPQLKALKHQRTFGKNVQRVINLIIQMLLVINTNLKGSKLQIKPKFKPFMPVNDQEQSEIIVSLYTSGLLSRKTALALLSMYVTDPVKELQDIESDEKKKAANAPKPIPATK